MMELEMYIDSQLIHKTPVLVQLLRKPEYLKYLMSGLEKKYESVLTKFSSKPVYILTGVQSRINNFVPLCPSEISQLTNTAVDTSAPLPDKMDSMKIQEPGKKVGLLVSIENKILQSM
jgi:hypothetical protein